MTSLAADIPFADEPDLLAGAILRSFNRHIGTKASWSFIKTLFWSTLTFGLLPLLIWPRGLRQLIENERGQFMHLAEWMRLRSGHRDSDQLRIAADRIRPIGVLSRGPTLLAIFIAIVFAASILQTVHADGYDITRPSGLADGGVLLVASTFQFGRTFNHPLITNHLFLIWSVGLTVAYTMHWLQLLAHVANVRGAVRTFNSLAISEGLPPVREPHGVGLRPIWLTAALIMMTASAVWAIPMMLAGGMQRRYAAVTGPALRATVADRLRDLLLLRRPIMRFPQMVELNRRCPKVNCRAAIGRITKFCPRCGTHVGPEIDELA